MQNENSNANSEQVLSDNTLSVPNDVVAGSEAVGTGGEEPTETSACGFKMEKPKLPKFSRDIREYAMFKADFKHAIESRYYKRDAVTFLRTCLNGRPLELIKGIGTNYEAAGDTWIQFTAIPE